MSEQTAEVMAVLRRLEQAEKYKAGAWGRVVRCAKQYAMMKLHGSYLEHGNIVRVGGLDRQRLETHFGDQVLALACDAMLEDAIGLEVDNRDEAVADNGIER